MERAGAHMHVASTIIFDGPPPTHEEFRDHIASRLHLVPRFRQKLRFVPFDQGRPVWVDDPHLNLDYHVRRTALPAPGDDEQLRTLAARIFSQELDRTKPLWELWLVEGLESDRFAIVGKSHHALVDGVSGVDITTVLFDLDPEPRRSPPARPPKWAPRPEPTDLRAAQRRPARARRPARGDRPRRARRRARAAPGRAASGRPEVRAQGGAADSRSTSRSARTAGFACVRADLADFKRIKDEHGGTVNDVVLTVVAGALGSRLRARGHDTDELELRAMVPVSVRAAEEHGALGNRVSAMMAPLPVWSEDPVERLRLVTATMGDLKGSKQAVGAKLLTELTDFAPPTIASQAARLQPRQRFFNLVVTNVPGPAVPALPAGPPDADDLPDGAARPETGGLCRDHELRRPGQLRPGRRLRRDGRPRQLRRRPRGRRPRNRRDSTRRCGFRSQGAVGGAVTAQCPSSSARSPRPDRPHRRRRRGQRG